MKLISILKSSDGEFEWTRSFGGIGVLSFILVANGLMIYQYWYLQRPLDIVAYCAAFPGGLGVALSAIGLTAGFKDRNVAAAQTVLNTGSNPATPPAPSPVAAEGELPANEKLP